MLVGLGGPLREKWLYAQPRDEESLPPKEPGALPAAAAYKWTEDAEDVAEEVLEESPLPDTERMELQLVILPLRQDLASELAHAAKRGGLQQEIGAITLLLRQRADPELADLEGMTPLSVAAAQGRVDVARALLAAQADVRKVDHQGRSALWTLV
eukprot:Skav203896  [mRNA]  locus=scaffold1649:174182:177971:- [translate_table: standard]